MKLYVESNFLVEIIESQSEANACRQLMSFCENGSLPFSIPQFCLFEVVEKIHRLNSDSGEFYKKLNQHLKMLENNSSVSFSAKEMREKIGFLETVKSTRDDELQRISQWFIDHSEILHGSNNFISNGFTARANYDLKIEDAIIFSIIRENLNEGKNSSIFVSKDRKGFDSLDIITAIQEKGCQIVFGFGNALNLVKNKLLNKKD